MGRKFFVGGNWKMNGDKASIDPIIAFLKEGPLDPNTDVVVAVPAPYLDYVRQKLPASIGVAGQNCHKVAKGAFTGNEIKNINISKCLFLMELDVKTKNVKLFLQFLRALFQGKLVPE